LGSENLWDCIGDGKMVRNFLIIYIINCLMEILYGSIIVFVAVLVLVDDDDDVLLLFKT
jgi:hypothetical protein